MNVIRSSRGPRELASPFYLLRTQLRGVWTKKLGLCHTKICWFLDLKISVSRTVRNKFLPFIIYPMYVILLHNISPTRALVLVFFTMYSVGPSTPTTQANIKKNGWWGIHAQFSPMFSDSSTYRTSWNDSDFTFYFLNVFLFTFLEIVWTLSSNPPIKYSTL